MEVSEASDISGPNELSRWEAAQDGLGTGGLVGPRRRGVSVLVSGGDPPRKRVSLAGELETLGLPLRGRLDAISRCLPSA